MVPGAAQRQHGDSSARRGGGEEQDERGEARDEGQGRHQRAQCPSLSRDPVIHQRETSLPWPSPRCSPGADGRRARLEAVSTSAMWLKACGKLPTRRLERGAYSSLSKPTSLRSERSRWKSACASSCRPSLLRASASQKLHGRKTPSPGGRPSTPGSSARQRKTRPAKVSSPWLASTVFPTRESVAGRKPTWQISSRLASSRSLP